MRRRGQGILEYILLTALVAFVSLLFFRTGLVDRTVVASNDYFKTGARAIMGGYFDKTTGEAIVENPDAVDGGWCAFTKCINGVQIRECACPRPSFGGAACAGAPVQACSGNPPAHPCPPGTILIPGIGCGIPGAPGGGLSCGDGLCSLSENAVSCPADCASSATCGNLICEFGETASCPGDCVAPLYCGDTICTAGLEDCNSCASDCGACGTAGNGICDPGENCNTDPGDCVCFIGQACYDDGGGFTCCTKNTNRCGNDGCGGMHADCQSGATCVSGNCVCGYTSCNGVCCAVNENCYPDISAVPKCCLPKCAGKCGGAGDGCGGVCADDPCPGVEVCYNQSCCAPVSCAGHCGGWDAGCGETCNGSCLGVGEVCYLGQCCDKGANCANRCNGVGDGCGGSCPMDCPSSQICNTVTNYCYTADCAGKNCGESDGNGGQCLGPCSLPQQCISGQLFTSSACVKTGPLTAACQYINAAMCPAGQVCYSNACCAPACSAADSCGKSDSCGSTCLSGNCTALNTCVSGVAYSARSCSSGTCVYGAGSTCAYGCAGTVCATCSTSCAGKCAGELNQCGNVCAGPDCGLSNYCVAGACVCGPSPNWVLHDETATGFGIVCRPSCGERNRLTGRDGLCTTTTCPAGKEHLGATWDCYRCCATISGAPSECSINSDCPSPYCASDSLISYTCVSHRCVTRSFSCPSGCSGSACRLGGH